jgi:Ca2+-binding EF-hand superfamily protein
MKTILLGISLAAMAGAGVAIAQDHGPDMAGMPGMSEHAGMDPMGDKTVTRAEAQAKAEEHFAKMDVNKDGKLDAADRAAFMGQAFDKLDTNKDGAISRDEFAAGRKDGAVSKDEFVAGHLKMFDMADTNQDGKLTPQERKAARTKMREHMRGMGHGDKQHGDHAMPPPPPPPPAG